jgi:hypothetical protein
LTGLLSAPQPARRTDSSKTKIPTNFIIQPPCVDAAQQAKPIRTNSDRLSRNNIELLSNYYGVLVLFSTVFDVFGLLLVSLLQPVVPTLSAQSMPNTKIAAKNFFTSNHPFNEKFHLKIQTWREIITD